MARMDYTLTVQAKTRTTDQDYIDVTMCQFGEIPAQQGSYELVASKVKADDQEVQVFKFNSQVRNPSGVQVRFNLQLQIDSHNVVNVQIAINPDKTIEWRWLAFIGEFGEWTSGNTHATWQDDSSEYLIYMVHDPDSLHFWVYLGQIPIIPGVPPAFFPPGSELPKVLKESLR